MLIRSNLVDIHRRSVYPAEIMVQNGRIASIREIPEKQKDFLLPGFIDAHVHIESSMVTPVAFSREVVRHGTVSVVSDPHEIANVLGREGVNFMVENARKTPLKICFGAPSCVPATNFESSGAELNAEEIRKLFKIPEIGFLSEMMNFPGVVNNDVDVLLKIRVARELGLPVDGHAPGLRGDDLTKYVAAGISTDHECFTYEEAEEKIQQGMKILIREGSGARNFNALIPLLRKYPEQIMFCTDDLHPDDLLRGHINKMVIRAVKEGYDLFDTLRAASWNAAKHYHLSTGMLRESDPADFILVDSLEEMNVISTFIDGRQVFERGEVKIEETLTTRPNIFNIKPVTTGDLAIKKRGNRIRVIQALDGELITNEKEQGVFEKEGMAIQNVEKDILKITVINRYQQQKPATGFIQGFLLKKGAIASSIAHDSHNIICVGASDNAMIQAINWIINHRGGIALSDELHVEGLPLEIAGIMSAGSASNAAEVYHSLTLQARKLGSEMKAPFMTLAFMALLVIPEIKLSDRGLFDGNKFSFVPLFSDQE